VGQREIRLALMSGFTINTLLYCSRLITPLELEGLKATGTVAEMIECSLDVFNRVAYRKDTGGVVAIALQKRISFDGIKLKEKPLLLVLESVEKPGNLGAVLRTADAAGLDAVIICDPQTDIYNPNTVRSSIGCIFTVPVVTSSSSETLAWLREKKISSCATALTANHLYNETDYRKPSAIIMGTESTGLSQTWLEGADDLIKIPMKGRIDSMNVSVSAAIVVFEALRQRNFR
jgi:TrmH family RNA methyltransferase